MTVLTSLRMLKLFDAVFGGMLLTVVHKKETDYVQVDRFFLSLYFARITYAYIASLSCV